MSEQNYAATSGSTQATIGPTIAKVKLSRRVGEVDEAGHSWAFSGYLFTAYNHAAPPNSGIWDCNLGVRDGRVGSFRASSYHRGGVTSMRMDGSVHFVSDTIDANVWQRLGSREDVEFR